MFFTILMAATAPAALLGIQAVCKTVRLVLAERQRDHAKRVEAEFRAWQRG